jgi:hypothetical protein
MSRPVTRHRRPGLAVDHGAVLAVVAGGVLVEPVTGTGAIGHRELDAHTVKGVLVLVALPLAMRLRGSRSWIAMGWSLPRR